MMTSASVPGSIRSTTVDTPRRASPTASRACLPSFSWVAGSAAVLVTWDVTWPAAPAASPATFLACSAAPSAASLARCRKLMARSSSWRRRRSWRQRAQGSDRVGAAPLAAPTTMCRVPPRPVLPADDLYARLEVPPTASPEAIELAWRALLRRHHPDVAGPDGLDLAKRINVAHDWLSDPGLRAQYDRERGLAGSGRGHRGPRDAAYQPRGATDTGPHTRAPCRAGRRHRAVPGPDPRADAGRARPAGAGRSHADRLRRDHPPVHRAGTARRARLDRS